MVAKVDHSALRVRQVCVAALTAAAFAFDLPLLALGLALVMGTGTVSPALDLFRQLYLHLLRPRGFPRPDIVEDAPEPHQFAYGLASGVLFLGATALTNGDAALGWGLTLLVGALALLNLATGICPGCFVYWQLGRLGIVPVGERPPGSGR